jgi:hypothetical protein
MYGHKEMAEDTEKAVRGHMTRAEEAIEHMKRAQEVIDYLAKDGHSLDQQLVVACIVVSELAFKADS